MLDVLDIDEATVVSEYRLEKWQAEFEAQFNAPMVEMEAMRTAAQQQQMQDAGYMIQNMEG